MPVLLPMGMAWLLELQVALTVCPEEESVAAKVTEPDAKAAVKLPDPCEMHPVTHEIVKPFELWLLTVSVVLAV